MLSLSDPLTWMPLWEHKSTHSPFHTVPLPPLSVPVSKQSCNLLQSQTMTDCNTQRRQPTTNR